ncbi:MAG: hypothetical protein AAF235_09145, partial [Planctomycetota bacterium]
MGSKAADIVIWLAADTVSVASLGRGGSPHDGACVRVGTRELRAEGHADLTEAYLLGASDAVGSLCDELGVSGRSRAIIVPENTSGRSI